MKNLLSALAIATLASAVMPPAHAQTVRPMTLWVDMDQMERDLAYGLQPPQMAELTALKATLDAKEAALRKRADDIARNQSVWSATRMDTEAKAYQAALADAQAAIDALRRRQLEMQAAEDARIATAIDQAMKDYAAGNPNLALLQRHRSGRTPDVVIRDQRYEVSDNLYERVKAGPRAVTSSPDGPTLPARVTYIRFEDAFRYSGTEDVWRQRAEPRLKQYWTATSDLQSQQRMQLAIWDSQAAALNEAEQASMKAKADAMDMRIQRAMRDYRDEVSLVRGEALEIFQNEFEQFLKTDPSLAGVDVIVFLGPNDPGVYAFTPGLDLTVSAAQAFGRMKGQKLVSVAAQPAAQQISQATDTIILYASPNAMMPGAGMTLSPAVTQRLKALKDKLAAEEAKLYAMGIAYDSNVSAFSPQQRIAEERNIQDAMKASQATARDLSQTMQQELSTLRFDFDARLNTALAAYRAANPGAGVLIMANDAPGRDSFVVRNTAYDLSGQLAAMVKAGPSAQAPAAPTRPAVVRYVNFQRALELTGQKARIDAAAATPGRGFTAQDVRNQMEGEFRENLATFLMADPSASTAEVIRFTGPGEFMGDLKVYLPRLDITDAVAAAYRQKYP
ncbi:MAG: hypothetical protein B7Y90_10695 [Alphaproteobacteria bacterium 32-64-14]|nr:MAG: hypothetical protein B7Y90_10695 [Alphaproteobacteria bacterium 32-64-14]